MRRFWKYTAAIAVTLVFALSACTQRRPHRPASVPPVPEATVPHSAAIPDAPAAEVAPHGAWAPVADRVTPAPYGAAASPEVAAPHAAPGPHKEGIDVKAVIFEHIMDAYEWHIVTVGERSIAIHLPVIVRSPVSGWHIFSSGHLEHGKEYLGFRLAHAGRYEGKVVELIEGREVRPIDISITRNVLSLMMSGLLLVVVVLLTARWYKRHDAENEAPRGLAACMEPVIMSIHGLARDNIGEDYRRFSPYLITAFLFIILQNLLGIVPFFPGGANVTGNIAVTMVMALFTFFTVNLHGTKHYYKEIFNPEVPTLLKPLMTLIEFFSALMKPLSLTIRLFANMIAGHMQILSVVCIIFIMAQFGKVLLGSMTVISLFFGIFLSMLEILISYIQAYVFTTLSAVYIGLARQKEE